MKAVQDNGWTCDLILHRDSESVIYAIDQAMLKRYLDSHQRRNTQAVNRDMRAFGYPSFRILDYSCRGAAQ